MDDVDIVEGAKSKDSKEEGSKHQDTVDEGVDKGVDEGVDEGFDEGVDGDMLLHRTVSFLYTEWSVHATNN